MLLLHDDAATAAMDSLFKYGHVILSSCERSFLLTSISNGKETQKGRLIGVFSVSSFESRRSAVVDESGVPKRDFFYLKE